MHTPTVCIVSADFLLTRILAERCARSNVQVVVARQITEAWKVIGRGEFQYLLLDLDSMGAGIVELCRELALEQPRTEIPTLILSGNRAHQQTWKMLCESLGFETQSLPQFGWPNLMTRICESLEAPLFHEAASRTDVVRHFGKVLCLDAHRQFSRELQMRMREHGVTVHREFNAVDGLRVATKQRPDAIITDFVLPKGLGSWVLGRLLDCGIQIPTLFVMDVEETSFPHFKSQLLDLGAAAVLNKPVKFEAILQALAKVMHLPTVSPQTPIVQPEPKPLVKPMFQHHREDQPTEAHPHIQFGSVGRKETPLQNSEHHPVLPPPHTTRGRTHQRARRSSRSS